MKKILWGFLIMIILVILLFGSFLILTQTSGSNKDSEGDFTSFSESSRTIDAPVMEEKPMTEVELNQTIISKRYLENTYLALEYSKVSNDQLINALKGYLDNPTSMKEEEVKQIITLNEKTFVNRYLKVYITSPDDELISLNYEMRQVLFRMKSAFDALHMYGAIPVDTTGVVITTRDEDGNIVDANGNVLTEEEAQLAEQERLAQVEEGSGDPSEATTEEESTAIQYDINGIPVNPKKEVKEPVFDIATIQHGISLLEKANASVDASIKKVGIADIEIEKKWIAAGISEREVLNLMDSSNRVDADLSDESEVGSDSIDNSTRGENIEVIDTEKTNQETAEYDYSIEEDASR